MEEKGPIKVKLSTAILLIVIFLLIIAMIFMYFYFKNSNSSENLENGQTQNNASVSSNTFSGNSLNNTQSSNSENTIVNDNSAPVSLSIESDEIKQLYNYVMKTNANQELLVYRSSKVTLDDLNNQLKLITVFQNVSESDATEVASRTDETGFTAKHIYYDKNTIDNVAKNVFGDNVSITHESCWSDFGYTRDFENGRYDCFSYQGGGGSPWENSASKLVKAEQVGNEIYIYDNYVHVYGDMASVDSSGYDIFDSSDKSLKIASNISFEQIFNGRVYPDVDFDNLQSLTGNKIKTYKHTFKKASDGSYYWFSTEPVKQKFYDIYVLYYIVYCI